MDTLFSYIISLGYKPFVTIPTIGMFWILKNYREELLVAWNVKGWSVKKNLQYHTLFSTIYEMRSTKVNAVRLENDKLKEDCLRIFLKCKIDAIEKHSKLLIENKVYRKGNDAFLNTIKMNLFDIQNDYNKSTSDMYLEMGISRADSAIVLTKWNSAHKALVESLESEITDVLLNPQVKSNYMKLIIIFNLYSIALKNTFDQGIDVFISMNGFFKRLNLER